MAKRWIPRLRAAAVVTALVMPGGCVALLAVALVRHYNRRER